MFIELRKKKMEKNILKKFGHNFSNLFSRGIWVIVVFLVLLSGMIALQTIFLKYNKRFDLTPSKKFSLSQQSLKILKNLKDNILVKAFYEKGKYFELSDPLSKFSLKTDFFRFEMINFDSNPKLAKDYGITRHGQCVLFYRDRQKRIQYPTESYLASAIIELTSRHKRRILFSEGHGERKTDNEDPNGLSDFKNELEKEYYLLEASSLIQGEDLNSRFDLIVVPGPIKDLLPEEIKTLEEYLVRGGSLLILLDPGLFPEIGSFLNSYGIELRDDIIIDEKNRYIGKDQFSPIIPHIKRHLLTEGSNIPPVFTLARSVSLSKKPCSGVKTQLLLKSSQKSYSIPYKTEGAKKSQIRMEVGNVYSGPVPVAAVAEIVIQKEEVKTQGRLVVIGDSDFLNNEGIYHLGNKDLILNTINWLVKREELIGIRPRSTKYYYPHLTPKHVSVLFWPTVVIMPVISFVLGIVIYVRRRMKN